MNCAVEIGRWCIPLGTVLGAGGVGLLAAVWCGSVLNEWRKR